MKRTLAVDPTRPFLVSLLSYISGHPHQSPPYMYIYIERRSECVAIQFPHIPKDMTASKSSDTSSFQQPLLHETQSPRPQPQPQPPQYVFVLPPYPPPRRPRLLRNSCRRGLISFAIVLIFLVAALYLLWPSDPELAVVRLNLDRIHFRMSPKVSIDITLDLTVRVRNQDLYGIDYDWLLVSIGYRGKSLGNATSDGGSIKVRGSSYVNATLQLDGVEILSDAILLVEDLAKGAITFDTESQISGKLRVFFFDLPLKTKISCEVVVNTRNQTISRQNCYPEVSEV